MISHAEQSIHNFCSIMPFQLNGDENLFFFIKKGRFELRCLESKYEGWGGLIGEEGNKGTSIWWRELSNICGAKNDTKWF